MRQIASKQLILPQSNLDFTLLDIVIKRCSIFSALRCSVMSARKESWVAEKVDLNLWAEIIIACNFH